MNEERKTTLVDEYNDMTHQWYEAHGVRLKKLKREKNSSL